MRYGICALLVVALVAGASAAPVLKVSIGVRETATTAPIGGNGGTGGTGIEWVNVDGQTLVLDGTWQQFTFNFATDPITAFTGNGLLAGMGDPNNTTPTGAFECIRFMTADENTVGIPISLYIDDVTHWYDPAGPPPPITTPFGTFEGYPTYPPGDPNTVMFRHPYVSGSTGSFIETTPASYANVDNTVFHNGAASEAVSWQFKHAAPGDDPWLRLTTNNAKYIPNPAIRFDQGSTLSFWIMGTPEPTSLALLLAGLLLRRR
jgi:hypothetical protein